MTINQSIRVAVIGTMNNPGTILMTVADLGSMEADLAVDETDLPRLQVGQKATLRIEAFPDQEFQGLVREVGSSPIRPGTEAATRTGSNTTEAIDFEVKVTIENPPAGIRPGFSVTVEIETGRASIGVNCHYPIPIHLQRAYEHFGYKGGDLPVSEALADEFLSLPLFPGMTEDQVDQVCAHLRPFAPA